MKESFQFEEQKKPAEKEKKSVWKIIKNIKNAAAFGALLALAAPAISSAGEINFSRDNIKVSETDKSQEKARADIFKIAENLKTKGRESKMGQTTIRKWVSEKKDTVTVGYASDGKHVWIIEETEGAKLRWFDLGSDGKVDVFISNNSTGPANRKAAFNDLKTFASSDNLAKEAAVGADLMPEDVQVYSFETEKGEPTIRAIDFKSGTTEKLIGKDAQTLNQRIQNLFNSKVAEHSLETAK